MFIEVNKELGVPEEVDPAQLELLTSSGQQDELTRDLLLDQAGCAESGHDRLRR